MSKTVSLIATVLNEEGSIARLLDSIAAQTRLPDEIVVVDGGSSDRTVEILIGYTGRLPVRVVRKPGCNISQGRNAAVAAATGEIVACTDAGVRLSPNWLCDLVRPLEEGGCEVVSGFFVSEPHSLFEVAMGATVLPAIEEIDPKTFLPSSRSVAYLKEAFRAVGGYPEWLDYGEDLVFDLDLRRAGYRFGWAPEAVAYFQPRSRLRSFFKQYYQYARGDGKADLWPKRHLVRYASYGLAPVLFAGGVRFPLLWLVLLAAFAFYLAQPYQRLFRQIATWPLVKKIAAAFWVPAIRATGDLAKMAGYPVGVVWRVRRKDR